MKTSRYILIIFFSFFGVGFFPFGQGTLASFITCIICYSFQSDITDILTVPLSVISLILSPNIKKIWQENDPHYVVIDEVSGMLISVFLLPKTLPVIIISFLIFRFLDISKIPPIIFFDRMKSPYGVILDDIVAGIMTNISVRILISAFPNLVFFDILAK